MKRLKEIPTLLFIVIFTPAILVIDGLIILWACLRIIFSKDSMADWTVKIIEREG